jgi:D-beta-D-heptose 7-phosphate kinase/D-beta-D-heptose 1-phosphate adenosyltransferase
MKILVVGESCSDEYVYGTCERVCPEAPALCFKSNGRKNHTEGMAANVVRNILSIFPSANVDLITNKQKITKRRFIDTRYNSIVFREDVHDNCERIKVKKHKFQKYDAIVISDYNKGFLEESDLEFICKNSIVKFMDTKRKPNDLSSIDFLKVNQKEYLNNIQDLKFPDCCQLIVTDGENGARHIHKQKVKNYPTKRVEIRDVCGAGDTFLAALVVGYLRTKKIEKSIIFANQCSLKVVRQFGVSTP